MYWIDIGIIALILYQAAAGFRNGMKRGAVELLGLIAIVIIAITQFARVADIIRDTLSISPPVTRWLSFFICLGVMSMLLNGVISLLSRFFRQRRRSWPDKIGGGFLGVARGMLTASIILVLLTSMPIPGFLTGEIERSPLAPSALAVVPLVYDTLAPRILPSVRSFREQLNSYLAARLTIHVSVPRKSPYAAGAGIFRHPRYAGGTRHLAIRP